MVYLHFEATVSRKMTDFNQLLGEYLDKTVMALNNIATLTENFVSNCVENGCVPPHPADIARQNYFKEITGSEIPKFEKTEKTETKTTKKPAAKKSEKTEEKKETTEKKNEKKVEKEAKKEEPKNDEYDQTPASSQTVDETPSQRHRHRHRKQKQE